MVSKSYVVSKFSKTLAKKIFSRSGGSDEEKCDCDDDRQEVMNDNNEKRKNKNNFVIQMNEMVVSESL